MPAPPSPALVTPNRTFVNQGRSGGLESGPYGAKSVSEICINGPLPTLSNAIFHATGVRLRRSPFTAERLWRGLSNPA